MNWIESLALAQAWLLDNGVRILVILVLVFFGMWFARVLAGRLSAFLLWKQGENPEMKKRAKTLGNFLQYFLVFLITITGVMMIMKEIGIEIRPILASAGIVGLAVGFGAQNLVQDVISGFFILLEDQIRVGDVVSLKGKGGLVEKVGLRMIVLRDFDGSIHYVRNGQIDIVTNMTKDFSNYVFDVKVPYGEDTERVVATLKEVDEEVRALEKFQGDILKPLEIFGVDQFAESWFVVKARISTKPLRQWDVGREFNTRLKKHFDAKGIPFATPVRTFKISEEQAILAADKNREGMA